MNEVRSSRPIPFALALSVIINLVLLGALAGFVLRPAPPPGPPGPRPFMAKGELSLSEEDRETLRTLSRHAFETSRDERDALREAQMALSVLLEQEPFDGPEVQEAFAALGKADQALNDAIRSALISGLGDLPADQRQRIARNLIERTSARGARVPPEGMMKGGPERWRDRQSPRPPESETPE